jgi:hypothetical protein
LKPQLEQIAANPSIFGEDISVFAKNVLKNISANYFYFLFSSLGHPSSKVE